MPKPDLVIASKNVHKVREIKEILAGLPLVVAGISEVADLPEIAEDGDTFEANAVKKALAAAKATGCMALADDSGLMVDYLGGEPGVLSARYAGSPRSDERNNAKLLAEMAGVPWEERDAHFHCVIAVAAPDGEVTTYRGVCSGKIGFEPRGANGFGYDPLFVVPELSQTFAELDPSVKNRISHRAKALAQLKEGLRQKFGVTAGAAY